MRRMTRWLTGAITNSWSLRRQFLMIVGVLLAALAVILFPNVSTSQQSQAPSPTMLQNDLEVRTVVSGLTMPTSITFLGPNDFLVLEKNSGRVQRVTNGTVQGTVLDLPVNYASERGLLSIALHPNFGSNGWVYLFWTCRSTAPLDDNPFAPEEQTCADAPTTDPDTEELLQVPLLGNRVDRFVWNGSTLSFDRHLITLLAFQNDGAPEPPGQGDAEQPARGNHDGGVMTFGPDGKLYIFVGDLGRRGQLQNLPSGPTPTGLGTTVPDDQFGGPQPDNAHFAGAILRLNDDGSTPNDNPFFSAGAAIGGEVGANVQKIFAYGFRNSFGMAFDPLSGNLWMQENGEDAFDEINRVEAGMNGGWIQIMGPVERVSQFREIETTSLHHEDFPNLQQLRWAPANIATTPAEAMSRLFVLPGSQYSDPEFSWKYVLAPAAIGFHTSDALGSPFNGDLFVGFALPEPLGGPLFRFNMAGDRRDLALDDPRLQDRVADNTEPHEMTESQTLLIGRDFGVVTDIKTGPNGNLFVVSLSNGAVYEVTSRTAGGTTTGTTSGTTTGATGGTTTGTTTGATTTAGTTTGTTGGTTTGTTAGTTTSTTGGTTVGGTTTAGTTGGTTTATTTAGTTGGTTTATTTTGAAGGTTTATTGGTTTGATTY